MVANIKAQMLFYMQHISSYADQFLFFIVKYVSNEAILDIWSYNSQDQNKEYIKINIYCCFLFKLANTVKVTISRC